MPEDIPLSAQGLHAKQSSMALCCQVLMEVSNESALS